MAMTVTALFDHSEEARRTMTELEASGFDCILVDKEHSEIGRHDTFNAHDLIQLGVAGTEAEFYAHALDDGASLLVISTGHSRLDELATLLRVAGLLEIPTPDRQDRLRFESSGFDTEEEGEFIDESGVHRSSRIRDEFRRADSERIVGEHESGDATGLSRRAYGSSSPEERDKEEIPKAPDWYPLDGQIPGTSAELPAPYDRYERAFRNHYDEHFADGDFDFRDYLRAYRYGVLLAEEQSFQNRSWDEIETFAQQGWDPPTHGPWSEFRPAVRFGWDLIRGGDERHQPQL